MTPATARLENAVKHLLLIAEGLPAPAGEALWCACAEIRRAVRILHAGEAVARSPDVARIVRALGGAVERVEEG